MRLSWRRFRQFLDYHRTSPSEVAGWTATAVLFIVLFGFVPACARSNRSAPAPEATPVPVVEPVDRDNGVYYFPVTGEAYIAALVKFYEGNGKHCDLQGFTERVVIRGSGQDRTQHTEATGFILHCHDMAVNAQDVTRE